MPTESRNRAGQDISLNIVGDICPIYFTSNIHQIIVNLNRTKWIYDDPSTERGYRNYHLFAKRYQSGSRLLVKNPKLKMADFVPVKERKNRRKKNMTSNKTQLSSKVADIR